MWAEAEEVGRAVTGGEFVGVVGYGYGYGYRYVGVGAGVGVVVG